MMRRRYIYDRVTHDAIHGSFYLHRLLWIIIDTPEFQRLRNIKQTGNAHYVYDGANHTRFEHSLGVAYLCGSFIGKLRLKLQDEEAADTDLSKIITNKDVLIIQIAGLCHDLGHCAFSHLFDGHVIPHFDPDSDFHHEQASCQLLKRIYQRCKEKFHEFEIDDDDINYICKLILGSPKKVPDALREEIVWTEADYSRQFMFEILANESDLLNGIDVDKFDYLKRDCHAMGINTGFDPQRLMEFAYIDLDEKNYPLKYSTKGSELIKEMWDARSALHSRAYQHRVVKCFDSMILEVFKLAGEHYRIGETPLSAIHKDLNAYIEVTDHILTEIKHTRSDELAPSRQILRQIEHRKIWKSILTIVSKDIYNLTDYAFSDNIVTVHCKVAEEHITYLFQKKQLNDVTDTENFKRLCNDLSKDEDVISIEIRGLKEICVV